MANFHQVILSEPMVRAYRLQARDEFTLDATVINNMFKVNTRSLKIGSYLSLNANIGIVCMTKIKRKQWWKIWKPKYVAAKFLVIEKGVF